MSQFRKPQTIKQRLPGSFVFGEWVEGAESTITINASVQPMSLEDMKALPEGRSPSDIVKMYTDVSLNTIDDGGQNQQPDILVWQGKNYELISKGVYQMDVIPHYKYLCAINTSA